MDCICNLKEGHRIYLGPQTYYIRRNRKGGTRQSGWLYGGRIGYERLKGNSLYLGFEAATGIGTIKGNSGLGSSLKSSFKDITYEWRLGYTFHQCSFKHLFFTPYILFESLKEINNFKEPSPLLTDTKIHATLAGIGFLSKIDICPCLSAGINFSAKFMLSGKNKFSNYPTGIGDETENFTINTGNQFHCHVEIPITYHFIQLCNSHLSVGLVPFYEYRKYESQENFPINFLETKFNFVGIFLKFMYRF